MELELRPRRSPFESGSSKASLATPSCCCCCCCVNAVVGACGAIGGNLKTRAEEEGRSVEAATWFGVLGFLFPIAFIFIAVGVLSLYPVESTDPWIVVIFALTIFVLSHLGLRKLAQPEGAFSVSGIAFSVGLLIIVGVLSVVDAIFILFTGGVGLILFPVAGWLGWKTTTSQQSKTEAIPVERAIDATATSAPETSISAPPEDPDDTQA